MWLFVIVCEKPGHDPACSFCSLSVVCTEWFNNATCFCNEQTESSERVKIRMKYHCHHAENIIWQFLRKKRRNATTEGSAATKSCLFSTPSVRELHFGIQKVLISITLFVISCARSIANVALRRCILCFHFVLCQNYSVCSFQMILINSNCILPLTYSKSSNFSASGLLSFNSLLLAIIHASAAHL